MRRVVWVVLREIIRARIIPGNIFRVNKQSLIALKHNLLLLQGIGRERPFQIFFFAQSTRGFSRFIIDTPRAVIIFEL